MKNTHHLKIEPKWFKEVLLKLKKFEMRYNDRDFKERDILILEEYDPQKKQLTGNKVAREVSGVFENLPGLKKNYVVLQIKEPLTNPFYKD